MLVLAESRFGRLDAMIANAGTVGGNAVARPMEQLTEQQWSDIIDVNLTGVYRSYRAAIAFHVGSSTKALTCS